MVQQSFHMHKLPASAANSHCFPASADQSCWPHLPAMQALLCDKILTQLETQGPRYSKQLQEREALHTLLKAVEAGHADAQLKLTSLLQVKRLHVTKPASAS